MRVFGSRLRAGTVAALVLCCLAILLALTACGGEQAAPTAAPAPGETPTVIQMATPVPAATVAPAPTRIPAQTPTATAVPAVAVTPTPAPALAPTATPASAPAATPTPAPTATPEPTATPTPEPTPTPSPAPPPTATPEPTVKPTAPTATLTPSPSPTATPAPTTTPAAADPALAGYAPLLAEAVSGYPAALDFVGDGLDGGERRVLDIADSRLFSNPNFLASKYSPNNWPAEVKTASVQAIPLLMQAIDIQKKADGKHVISWEVDSLDRVLDDLGIYEGVCVSCYGKNAYSTVAETVENHYPIVSDRRHVHREMLKTFAYLALADGEGILVRSFMENDADDFELLYHRETLQRLTTLAQHHRH